MVILPAVKQTFGPQIYIELEITDNNNILPVNGYIIIRTVAALNVVPKSA